MCIRDSQASAPESALSIYTIAFERYKDIGKINKVLTDYKKVMDFDWPLLYGGYANKTETAEKLPFLDKIYSYPTLLMIDKNNEVRYIHTGFNGPATSKYEKFKLDFNEKLNTLLSE